MNANIQQLCGALTALGVPESEKLLPRLGIDNDCLDAHKVAALAPGDRKQLGELLHLAGKITSPQLEDALAYQARSGGKLGAILVDKMLINESELQVLLAFQTNQSQQPHNHKKLKLGTLLVAMGEITQEQLDLALDWQVKYGVKLGEALIATGHANQRQINKGLNLQSKLLIGLLLVAMAHLSPFSSTNAYAGNITGSAIQVSTTVLPSARMHIKYQVGQINITAKDIAQGYVDAQAASVFTVATARGTTYYLDIHPQSDIFSSVKIEGLGGQVILGTEGGAVTRSDLGLKISENTLNYHFILKASLQPGTYDWPLQLAVRVQ